MGKAARKLTGAALSEFNTKHPRGAGGRFVKAGAGVATPAAPTAPTPGRARARLGLSSKVDMPAAMETLRAKKAAPVSGDREAVDAILAPMTVAQLDEVGAKFGISTFGRTKAERARQLREGLVGARLDRDAIMSIDLGSGLPLATQAEADEFFARNRRDSLSLADRPGSGGQTSAQKRERAMDLISGSAATDRGEQRRRLNEAEQLTREADSMDAADKGRARRALARPKPPTAEERIANLNAISGGEDIWAKRRLAGVAEGRNAQAVRYGLAGATSEDEARKMLGVLKVAELKRIAGELDVPGSTGPAIRDALVKIYVTGRLTTASVKSDSGRAASRLRAGSGPKA